MKRILLVILILLSAILAACGIAEDNKTELTATPTSTPIPTAAQTPTPSPVPVISLPPIPENFVVEDHLWDSASYGEAIDGTTWEKQNFIIFTDIPVGTILYAPIEGYVHAAYSKAASEEEYYMGSIYIGEIADWLIDADKCSPAGRYVVLAAKCFELLEVGLKDSHVCGKRSSLC